MNDLIETTATPETPTLRTCNICLTPKPIHEFHERIMKRQRKNGKVYDYIYRSLKCKSCENQNRVAYGKTDKGLQNDAKAQQKYYNRHKQKIKEYQSGPQGQEVRRKYWRSPKGKVKSTRQTVDRRVGLTDEDTLTPDELAHILNQTQSKCQYCRKQCRLDVKSSHPDYLTLDHVIPLEKGGRHTKNNIVVSCRRCNIRKGTKIRIPKTQSSSNLQEQDGYNFDLTP